MNNIVYIAYTAQIIAIFILFIDSVYVLMQRPSKVQMQIFVLLISTLLMLVGYLIELTASCVEAALIGVYVSYLGKPFALLATTLFVAEYCHRPVPRKYVVPLIIYHSIFPVIIFTNEFHYLYYSYVSFDASNVFSPLILGHGPLYFLYMLTIFVNMAAVIFLTIHELKESSSSVDRKRVLLIIAALASTIVGYLCFLTGATLGFDTTIIGAVFASVFISVLFYKYRIFDLLTLAKEKSFHDSSTGLIVLSPRGVTEYSNNMMNSLLKNQFALSELRGCPLGITVIQKDGPVYEVKRTEIIENDVVLGEFIEVIDITDKFNYSSSLEKEVRNRTREIIHLQRTVLSSFADVVEARDSSTGVHIKRMSKYVEMIARKLQEDSPYSSLITDEYITALVDVAPLHDIGKIVIPDSILLKPGKLSEEEFNLMKTHTRQGAKVIDECLSGVENERYIALAMDVALYHHEKWDGTGYPEGLKGDSIPLCARIVALSDVFDAISTQRCYKPAFPIDKCLDIVRSESGHHFDPVIVDAFLSMEDEIRQMHSEYLSQTDDPYSFYNAAKMEAGLT